MIDQSVNNSSIVLTPLPTPFWGYISNKIGEPTINLTYPFRYTVHRQHVGFFTPMVFDVSIDIRVSDDLRYAAKKNCDYIVEPFVEGALFCNHTSFAIVEFLKGQNFGYNRKELLEQITKEVDEGNVWYSDWIIPPPTIQSQRIFVYNSQNILHGSMLSPTSVCSFVARKFDEMMGDDTFIHNIRITAGYTNDVDLHGASKP